MKKNKKILSAVAVLALSAITVGAGVASGCSGETYNEYGSTYYVSVEGTSNGTGAKNNPYDITTVLTNNILKPGDTVLVQPGVYKLDRKIQIRSSGTYKHNITIKNASDTEKAVLDFSDMYFLSTNRGVELYANYVYWYGIDICGAGDNGMYIGGSYNTVEYCEFYNNRDTGLQIGRQESAHTSIDQWPSYNLIKNCTSHNNYDNETYGENADGFAAKLTVGYGNVFDGCIAYRNSDDGWDLYAKSDSGNIGQVIIYNCVAFENGYLEYTQETCNKIYKNFNKQLQESNTNSYMTRDGDGNGFKLGGSVMEGDVLVYNCLSFGNRMHGVTDNSNPGYLSVEEVTAYNNSAAVDNDPASATFGQIVAKTNHDDHNNIDVARQTYSYNTVKSTLSVTDEYAKSLGNDEYRGSVYNSMLVSGSKTNKVSGWLDADTRNEGKDRYTEQIDALVAADVFETLPFTSKDGTYTYNISGLKDLGANYENGPALNEDRVHHKYRNEDGSVNMGSILAVKDYSKLLGADNKIGSQLNKSAWGDYTHFTDEELFSKVNNSVSATLEKAKETLYVTTDVAGCYQDFDVPTHLNGCYVSWTSSDESILKIGREYDTSVSQSEYVTVEVTRPAQADKKVTLTATLSLNNVSTTKTIEINVRKDEPKVGSLSVVVGATGKVIENNGTIIFDQYFGHEEPMVKVTNGAYKALHADTPAEGKTLTKDQYNLTTKYEYATEDGKPYSVVSAYTPNVPGVFRITHTVTLKGDETSTNTMTYKIFVASNMAALDWSKYENDDANTGAVKGDPINAVSVNQLGYKIGGRPNSAIGYLYAFTSTDKIENPTADLFIETNEEGKIVAKQGVIEYGFRDTEIEYQYSNPNNAAYYIYYALANGQKAILPTSIYEKEVKTVNIETEDQFKTIAHGGKVSGEDPSLTIYMLTKCLDLTGYGEKWDSNGKFTGVLNGMGHTISNFEIKNAKAKGKASMFYEVDGGSIMNVKFDNITLQNTDERAGIIGICYGGFFSNIQITNIDLKSSQRSGGLIAQLNQGSDTYIDRVSVINNDDTKTIIGDKTAGGILGLIQIPSSASIHKIHVYISNCYSDVVVGNYQWCGGIVGRYDTQIAGWDYNLEIKSCVSASKVYAGHNSAGGILGAQQGTGRLRIEKCLFVGELYHAYEANEPIKLETSQKNSSGMIGAFVATATDVMFADNISVIPEYNPEYAGGVSYFISTTVFANKLMLGNLFNEEIWEYNYVEGSDQNLKEPFVTLKFGTWECECEPAAPEAPENGGSTAE